MRAASISTKLKKSERREIGSEARAMVLCVEVEKSGKSRMNISFIVEKARRRCRWRRSVQRDRCFGFTLDSFLFN